MNKQFDKYEFYSFSLYLYLYGFFYLFIFNQNLLKIIFINIFFNVLTTYSLNHNIFVLIKHNYWKNNLNDIALPQLISCSTSLITYDYNYYLMIPINTITYLFIEKFYKKENRYSKNLRIILMFLFFISKFIF